MVQVEGCIGTIRIEISTAMIDTVVVAVDTLAHTDEFLCCLAVRQDMQQQQQTVKGSPKSGSSSAHVS